MPGRGAASRVTGEPNGRVGTRVTALLGAAVMLAVLAPQADRGALIARGVSHLLTRDLENAPGAAPQASIFAALDALIADRPVAQLALTFDARGARLDAAETRREFTAQLRRYEARRRVGLPHLRVVGEGAAAALHVRLEIADADGTVSLAARLAHGGRQIEVTSPARWRVPGRASLAPPLLAVCVALLAGRTLLALFLGIYAGAALLAAQSGGAWLAPLRGLWDVFAVYFWHELADRFRIEIIGFIVALIAMLGIMNRAGGMQGLLRALCARARSARSAQFVAWCMGLLVFFDDYANCMLVGSTMRPLTDLRRVSREKLAYIVDSTAAPVVGISLVSTWVAFMVSVYSDQLPDAGISDSGYAIFLQTLPYRFYCLLTLFFVAAVIAARRDFGPMERAERRARTTGALVRPGAHPPIRAALEQLEPAPGMTPDWRRAALPIGVTLLVTLARIFVDGGGGAWLLRDAGALRDPATLLAILAQGGGAGPIFAGALAGLLCAAFLAGSNRARVGIALGLALGAVFGGAVRETLSRGLGASLAGYAAWALLLGAGIGGAALVARRLHTARPFLPWLELRRAGAGSVRTLVFAVVLIFEAWMLGAVCRDLSTADYLVALLSGALPAALLPVLLFSVACLVAFATGSSWSTLSILLPNVVALAASLGAESALGVHGMVVVSISAVLEGSIFGDHCSPISDTTVLSSVASGCDHIDHVRTQLPYALCTAAVAILCGYLPLLLVPGWSAGAALLTGALALLALLVGLGRREASSPP
jgi:Na+/H+ antiporter NhaC